MSSSSRPIIAVVGATGNQGGSVASTFLSLGTWHVRGLTRNPASAASQALAENGAEMVAADLSDTASLETAFAGAAAIFANTDFWITYRAPDAEAKAHSAGKPRSQYAFDQEVAWGRNIARVASRMPTLERFVYSALSPSREISKGKYPHMYHWDSKAAIVKLIRSEYPSLAAKMSIIQLGAYFQMFHWNPMLQPHLRTLSTDGGEGGEGEDEYVICNPMTTSAKMPYIDPTISTGPFVHALITSEPPLTNLLAYDSFLTSPDVAEILTRVSGHRTTFESVSVDDAVSKYGIGREVLESPAFISEFGFAHGFGLTEREERDAAKTREDLKLWKEGGWVGGPPATLEEWMREQDWEKKLEIRSVEDTFKAQSEVEAKEKERRTKSSARQ